MRALACGGRRPRRPHLCITSFLPNRRTAVFWGSAAVPPAAFGVPPNALQPHQRDPTRKRPFLFKPASSGEASRVFSLSLGGEPPSNSAPLLPLLHKSVEERVGERSFPPQISRILHSAFCILHSAFSCPPHPWFKSLQCNSVESCNSNKILTAKERKEHIDKSLWLLFFAICAFFVVNSSLVAALPRCAFESLRLCVEFLLLAASPRRLPFRQMSLNWIPGRLKL